VCALNDPLQDTPVGSEETTRRVGQKRLFCNENLTRQETRDKDDAPLDSSRPVSVRPASRMPSSARSRAPYRKGVGGGAGVGGGETRGSPKKGKTGSHRAAPRHFSDVFRTTRTRFGAFPKPSKPTKAPYPLPLPRPLPPKKPSEAVPSRFHPDSDANRGQLRRDARSPSLPPSLPPSSRFISSFLSPGRLYWNNINLPRHRRVR